MEQEKFMPDKADYYLLYPIIIVIFVILHELIYKYKIKYNWLVLGSMLN